MTRTDLSQPDLLRSDVTYASVYIKALERRAETVAMTWVGGEITYGDMLAEIYRTARAFKALGLSKGDTVAHLSGNSHSSIVTWVSCALLGLRYTPLHPMGTPDADQFIIGKASVKAVVIDGALFADRLEALVASGNVAHVLDLSDTGRATDFAALRGAQSASLLPVEASADDIIAVFFTGGTTGEPKGVMHDSRSLVANALISSAEWAWPKKIDFYAATPISHALGYVVLPVLMRGGTLHLRDKFSPQECCELIDSGKVNALFAVPTMIYAILDMPDVGRFDFSNLEMMAYGAAPITRKRLEEALDRFGPVLMQGYGQTEAPNALAALMPQAHTGDRLNSCGAPLVGNRVAILDEDMNELPRGERGEICVRGPLIMRGYLDNPTVTEHATRGGWLHTEDIGYLDDDGFLYVVDRAKDMIITGGFNVYPKEVENALATHPAVAECAVVGLPDDRWGESVAAMVKLREGQSVAEADLIGLVKDRAGAVNAPKTITFTDQDIPRTPLGKLDKKAVREALA